MKNYLESMLFMTHEVDGWWALDDIPSPRIWFSSYFFFSFGKGVTSLSAAPAALKGLLQTDIDGVRERRERETI